MVTRRSWFRTIVICALACFACNPNTDDRAYDEASEALAKRIEAIPRNRGLREAVDQRLSKVDRGTGAIIARRLGALRIAPLRVPGLLYRSHPESGADLSAVNSWLAQDVPLVPVDEVGTVEENAAVIVAWVQKLAVNHTTIALISASKGSADVLAALESRPDLGSLVTLWLDLVGVLEGTPLTNPGTAALDSTTSWLPAATAKSMSERWRKVARSRGAFPHNVRAVHVAAFPTVEGVSAAARQAFQLLRTRGPTDGYVLLESYLRAPGRVLILRGTDHYLRTPRIPPLVAANFLVILDEVEAARPKRAGVMGTAPRGARRGIPAAVVLDREPVRIVRGR